MGDPLLWRPTNQRRVSLASSTTSPGQRVHRLYMQLMEVTTPIVMHKLNSILSSQSIGKSTYENQRQVADWML